MTARGPRRQERTAGQPTAGRHGEVSMEMTADELLSLAVNIAQNGWPLDKGSAENSAALRKMLTEVYEQTLSINRQAVERTVKTEPDSAREFH